MDQHAAATFRDLGIPRTGLKPLPICHTRVLVLVEEPVHPSFGLQPVHDDPLRRLGRGLLSKDVDFFCHALIKAESLSLQLYKRFCIFFFFFI